MTDIVLKPIVSGYNISIYNDNSSTLENVINTQLLHLVGGNNILLQDVDLNSHDLLNVKNLDVANIRLNGQPIAATVATIPPNAITSTEIAAGAVTAAKIDPAYDVTLTKVANLASSSGASSVGYQDDGTGAVLGDIKSLLLGFFKTPQMYGAKGDDVTDDTAALQAWINACQTLGYKAYLPSVASGYKVTAPLNITAGLHIYGEGCEPSVGTIGTVGVRGRGSWLHFAHSGLGFNIDGGANGRSGIILEGIGTYRDQPTPNGAAYTPGVFDYDIKANRVELVVKDVVLLNPTKGISHTNGGYGRLTIQGLKGQPLSEGINISESYDTGRVRDIHFWPFWSNDTGVRDYMRQNGKAFIIYRWDNSVIDNCFAIGYSYFIILGQNTSGHVNKLIVTNCDGDLGGYFLYIDTAVNGAQVQMSNCRTQGANTGLFPANFSNIQINGSNNRLVCTNVELRYPQGNCVRVQGSGNNVQLNNMTYGAWNQVLSTYTAVNAVTSGNTIIQHGRPTISEAGGSSTGIYAEVSGSTVSAPLTSGVTSITTDASGYATITHNAGQTPRKVVGICAIGSTFYHVQPTGNFTSTTFDVQVRVAGGAIAASTTLTVDWKLEY